MNQRRVTIASVIFVLCCLLSSARLVLEAPTPDTLKDSPDEIARSDHRFAALKATLPERGIMGYVGETGDSAVGHYYLAQYALAPLVLDHSEKHPLVVGNFSASPAASPEGLHLIKDFGNGVLLFANPLFDNKAPTTRPATQ